MSAEYALSTSDWRKIPVGRGETLEKKEGIVDGEYALWQAEVGDIIRITSDVQGELLTFDFNVLSAGEEPTVAIVQTNSDGSTIETGEEVQLRGSGRWTTYKNNPMVRGIDPEMSIYYGTLYTGGETVVFRTKTREHYRFGESKTIEIISMDYSEPSEEAAS